MKTYNLEEEISFSKERPIKKDFFQADGFETALICLKSGVEIPPRPEDYAVLLVVLEGKGVFTDADGESILRENQSIYVKKDEPRGIKAKEDLVILGVKDKPRD